MRKFSIALVIGVALLTTVSAGGAYAASDAHTLEAHTTVGAQQQQQPVNQHNDTRVAVQLTVLGLAAVLVVVVGTGAYFLRKKLGLTAYDPKQADAVHH